MGEQLQTFDSQGDLAIRVDAAKRQIDVRLYQYNVPGQTEDGPELIERGALEGVDPAELVARLDHLDPAFGGVVALDERDDGPYATLQALRTPRGDEALELAQSRTYRGASVGFERRPPDAYRTIDGQRTGIRKRLGLREISLTWRPAHPGAVILATRAEDEPVSDQQAPQAPDQAQPAPAAAAPAAMPEGALADLLTRMQATIAANTVALEERARRLVEVPAALRTREQRHEVRELMGRWVRAALTSIDGDKVPEMELRALADVVTADNLGVVPKNIRSEVLGIIDPARPFLESTREVDPGDAGMTQTFPKITQRPTTGIQAAEKDELASQKTIITTQDFGVVTIGGAGDLSIQLLKRSSPAFLQLWFELLAESYAIQSDNAAVDALLAAGVAVGTGTFDPATFLFGEAFTNSAALSQSLLLRPDRIWLSTAAFVSMIDARTPAGGGGTPMYPGLVELSGITSSPGNGPFPLRLQPILVPALDDEAVDVVIGPSRGFAWAEDGTYQLQADNPGQAGRDVALVGMLWFMPVYPGAFTTYALAP